MSPALNFVDAYEDYKDLPGIRSDAKVKTRVNDNYSNAGFDTGYTDYIKVNKDTPYNRGRPCKSLSYKERPKS